MSLAIPETMSGLLSHFTEVESKIPTMPVREDMHTPEMALLPGGVAMGDRTSGAGERDQTGEGGGN